MGKFVPSIDLDLILDRIALSTEEAVLTQDPTTYFNCVSPSTHALSTTYALGDMVKPATSNGFIYECVGPGDSGVTEPGWITVQDAEFTESGGVTWKAHENYVLASAPLTSGDFTKSDFSGGRQLTVSQKANVLVYRTGIPKTVAFINHATKTLHAYTETRTAIIVNNQIIYPDPSERDKLYAFGDTVFADEISSTYFECLVPGTSGPTEPTWGTIQNAQFVDGEVTWRTQIATAELMSGTLVDFLSVPFTSVVV